jgi:hypothetical protein
LTVLAVALFVAGCSGTNTYFPLEPGQTWTYNIRADLATYVEEVKVTRRVAVAGVQGFELGGPLGYSRVAWKGGVLLADSLPNTGVSPPLPLLVPGDPNTLSEEAKKDGAKPQPVRRWQGFVESRGKKIPAKATLYQEEATLTIEPRKHQTIKTTIRMFVAGKTLELVTWYADGMGPLRQEQHTDGLQDISMEYIASP